MERKKINCPNCGSPIQDDQCRFCGSVFLDWSIIDFDKPFFLKFRRNGKVYRAKCRMREFSFSHPSQAASLYYDGEPTFIMRSEPPVIDISLCVEPVDKTYMLLIEEDIVNPDDLKPIWERGKED